MGVSKIGPSGGKVALAGVTETVQAVGAATGVVALDLASATVFDLTATGNVTISFANPPAAGVAGRAQLLLRQGAAGNKTWTFPAGTRWTDGPIPQFPTAALAGPVVVDLVTVDGGATWLASVVSGATASQWPAAVAAAGADFVTAWTADAHNPFVGNGTLLCRHVDVGKLCICSIEVVLGSTTVVRADAGIWRFLLPHIPASTLWHGTARFIRASGAQPNAVPGEVFPTGGQLAALNMANGVNIGDMDAAAGNVIGGVAVDTGDLLIMSLAFESA